MFDKKFYLDRAEQCRRDARRVRVTSWVFLAVNGLLLVASIVIAFWSWFAVVGVVFSGVGLVFAYSMRDNAAEFDRIADRWVRMSEGWLW